MSVGKVILAGTVSGLVMAGWHYLVAKLWEVTVGLDTPAKLGGLAAVQLASGTGVGLGVYATKRWVPEDVAGAAGAAAIGTSVASGIGLGILAVRLHLAVREARRLTQSQQSQLPTGG